MTAKILFTRHYRAFTGGHLKVFHYMEHLRASKRYDVNLYLTPNSDLAAIQHWLPKDIPCVTPPFECDALFVAGMDWALLDKVGQPTRDRPVINLIQSERHAFPDHPLYQFLDRPALRICVSAPVQEALQATGRVNGPIECIPNGLDIEALATQRQSEHNGKILVDGTKNAQLAASIGEALARHGAAYEVLTKRLPRPGYLRHLSGFSAAVLLPLPYEGFYLPALEAMALGVPLVIPPCTGTRDFCIPDKTCLSPDRAPDALAEAATQLLANPERAEVLRRGGYDMATRHSLKQERQALFDILGKHFA